jgi:hypothetical protein
LVSTGRAYLDFVTNRPLLAELAGYAYMSLLPAVRVGANGAHDRQPSCPNLRRWMLAFGLALIIDSPRSRSSPRLLPPFVYLDLTPQVYANISSTVYTHVPTLEALRAGHVPLNPTR